MFVRIDSNYKLDDKLIEMCESAHYSNDPTSKNIEYLGWKSRPETLLHQIYIQKIYDEGGYFVYEEGGEYLGGLGFYPFEYDSNIFVSPVRMYVIQDLGFVKSIRVIQKLFNYVCKYAEPNFRAMIFFVNENNEWRIKSIKSVYWKNEKNKYAPWPTIEAKQYHSKVNYKYTKQIAVYIDYSDYEEGIIKCLKKISL